MRTPPNHALRPDVLMGRSMPAIGVALLAVVVAAAPVGAATVTVRMDDGRDFHPSVRSIGRGDTVRWKNNASFEDHDVFGTQPSKYFKSGKEGGMDPGDAYSKAFKSAGSFPYLCRIHSDDGMTGRIIVPMAAKEVDGGDRFKLTVASADLPSSSSFRHVIQVDTPGGSSTFVDWRTTRMSTAIYTPGPGGTYRFRALVERTSNGTRSDPSPIKTLTH
jgi:plastocyanin